MLHGKVAVIPIALYIKFQDNMLKTVGLFSYNGALLNPETFIEDSHGLSRAAWTI